MPCWAHFYARKCYKYYTKLYMEHGNTVEYSMHKIATNVTIVTRLNIYEAYNTMSISEKT